MRIAKIFVAFAATTLMLAACANQKEPAEKAVAQVESSLAEFKADAEKYAAEDLKGVDDSVNKLKKNLANKDYSAVVIGAPGVASAVKALKTTVEAKKAEVEATIAEAQSEWTDLSAKMPQMVEAIQSRVDTLTKSRKLPKDLDKATFDTVKTDFETLKTEWTEASSQFASGAAAEAVRKARSAKAKGEEILTKLGMTTPG
jgi:ActR/RegA family two-component response regulator